MASLQRLTTSLHKSYISSTSTSTINRSFTSWLLPPAFFAILRLLISFYCFVVLFYAIGWQSGLGEDEKVQQSFSYFTVLGYWGLAFYFAFTAVQTGSVAWKSDGQAWLVSWPTWLRGAFAAYQASVTIFPFVVTAIFWSLLSANAFESRFSTFTNISEHALNSVFAFAEIVLANSEPHAWIYLPLLIVILAAYLGLAYLTHATEDFWVYSFLDGEKNSQGAVAGYCFAILGATIVAFVLVRYLQMLRRWLTEDLWERKKKGGERDGSDLEMGVGEKQAAENGSHGNQDDSKANVKAEASEMALGHSKETASKGFEG